MAKVVQNMPQDFLILTFKPYVLMVETKLNKAALKMEV
jgi:hypothetical protein